MIVFKIYRKLKFNDEQEKFKEFKKEEINIFKKSKERDYLLSYIKQ